MARGDIGAIIATEEWSENADVYYLRSAHRGGNVFMVGTKLPDGLYVFTVSVSAVGAITLVGSQRYAEFTSGGCGGFAQVNEDVWAVAYVKMDGPGLDGSFVGTFTCDSSGNLGAALIDTFRLAPDPANAIYAPDIIPVSGNVFAAPYTEADDDGWVKTITINNDGSIDDVELDSWEFDVSFGRLVSIWHRSGTVYMITYGDHVPNGYIITFNIQDDGTLPPAAGTGWIQRQAIANQLQSRATVLPISGDVYAIIWHGTDNDGWVCTYPITTAGAIGTREDLWEFEAVNGHQAHGIVVDDNEAGDGKVVCALHLALGNVNAMHTFEISNTGTITKSFISEAVLDTDDRISYPLIEDATGVAPNLYVIFYQYAADNDGWVRTREIEGAPLVPTVTTDPASGVAVESATLNGTLDAQGAAACDCGFEWGETDAYGNTTPTQSRTTGQTFAQTITGLDPNKTYHFRAFATNPVGTSYGADRTFTTLVAVPTLTTDPASGVGATSATLNGTLDDDGGEACDCGFEWGETGAYGDTTPTQSRTTGQTFAQTITGLDPNKTYHFRAFATNSAGTSYGADRTFTTLVAAPTVTTDPASGEAVASATLNSTLDDDGGEACDCGFEWGLDTGYGTIPATQTKTTGETFSQALGGLHPNTTYHFRAFATNSAGTSYGADRSFTTALVITRAYALARQEL